MSPITCRRAGDDAIIIAGKALCFHKSLTAPVGAGAEIGTLRCGAIEGLDESFRVDIRQMNGAIPEIYDFFGVMQRPGCISVIGIVPVFVEAAA